MKVLSLQLGGVADVAPQGSAEWWDKEWRTGFYKQPVTGPQWLGYQGFRGDEQADRKYHGGVDKAVCVYASEHFPYWLKQLNFAELPHGAFGENFTTSGLLETDVCVGDVFSVGEALVQVSQPRQPCWKLARRWRVKDLTAQVEQTGFTGFYFRVLRHGRVQAGDAFAIQERAWPQWSIQRCNEIMHHEIGGPEAAAELAAVPSLSGSWKDSLWAWAQATSANSKIARIAQP